MVPVLFDFSCCFSSSQGIGTGGCQNTLSCDETNLNESSTFFLEYVLEDSNDADYFMKHVVGFTFASSNGSMNTTVWFSNRVSLPPGFLVHSITFVISALELSFDKNNT